MFLAGQVPTADELNALVAYKVTLGSAPSVTSSTTLVDTDIVVPIDGLTLVRVSVRFTALGGGIRWAWSSTGTVTTAARDILSPGSAASDTAGSNNFTGTRHRQNATITEEQEIVQFDAGTTFLINEQLVCDGSGVITFRFAQQASNASATTLSANSYATYQLISEA